MLRRADEGRRRASPREVRQPARSGGDRAPARPLQLHRRSRRRALRATSTDCERRGLTSIRSGRPRASRRNSTSEYPSRPISATSRSASSSTCPPGRLTVRRITEDPPSGGQARSTTIATRTSTRRAIAEQLDRLATAGCELLHENGGAVAHERRAERARGVGIGDEHGRHPFPSAADGAPRGHGLDDARKPDLGRRSLELRRRRGGQRARGREAQRGRDLQGRALCSGRPRPLRARREREPSACRTRRGGGGGLRRSSRSREASRRPAPRRGRRAEHPGSARNPARDPEAPPAAARTSCAGRTPRRHAAATATVQPALPRLRAMQRPARVSRSRTNASVRPPASTVPTRAIGTEGPCASPC